MRESLCVRYPIFPSPRPDPFCRACSRSLLPLLSPSSTSPAGQLSSRCAALTAGPCRRWTLVPKTWEQWRHVTWPDSEDSPLPHMRRGGASLPQRAHMRTEVTLLGTPVKTNAIYEFIIPNLIYINEEANTLEALLKRMYVISSFCCFVLLLYYFFNSCSHLSDKDQTSAVWKWWFDADDAETCRRV